jgi:sphinganine-1-phosphate aldolase
MKSDSELAKGFYTGEGSMTGGVYITDPKHWELVSKTMEMWIVSNPLHNLEFEKIGTMESEILKMVLKEFNAPLGEGCGITTSGGTESIIMALCAYREYCKKTKGIVEPNIVVSETVHAAFEKGCFYLKIELRRVTQKNQAMDVATLESLIDSNTICIVGSAPDYAFGNFDPIEELSALAIKYDVGLHVDACLGSFNLPFASEAGF